MNPGTSTSRRWPSAMHHVQLTNTAESHYFWYMHENGKCIARYTIKKLLLSSSIFYYLTQEETIHWGRKEVICWERRPSIWGGKRPFVKRGSYLSREKAVHQLRSWTTHRCGGKEEQLGNSKSTWSHNVGVSMDLYELQLSHGLQTICHILKEFIMAN